MNTTQTLTTTTRHEILFRKSNGEQKLFPAGTVVTADSELGQYDTIRIQIPDTDYTQRVYLIDLNPLQRQSNGKRRSQQQILNILARQIGDAPLTNREWSASERHAIINETEKIIDAQWGIDGSASDWLLGLLAELALATR